MTTQKTTDPVVRIARDLTEILNLSQALTAQAIQHARDRLVPGGYAMIALGPVADPDIYAARIDAHERRAYAFAESLNVAPDELMPELYDDDTWEPPFQTLRYWAARWRETKDHEGPAHPNLNTEASYIRGTLDWALTNEPRFTAAAKDINTARRRLENLLHAGNRPDRTRVTCDRETCDNPRQLIRIRETRKTVAWSCPACKTEIPTNKAGAGLCTNPSCTSTTELVPVWGSDPDNDRWKCTSCKARFTDEDYRRAHAKQLRSQGAEKYVLLNEAIATLKTQGRSTASVRQWLKVPEHIADECTRCNHRYDPSEHAACPRILTDPTTKQDRVDRNGEPITCGGDLSHVYYPDLDDIPAGYCELGSRRRFTWWPDLWRKHLTTQTRRRKTA